MLPLQLLHPQQQICWRPRLYMFVLLHPRPGLVVRYLPVPEWRHVWHLGCRNYSLKFTANMAAFLGLHLFRLRIAPFTSSASSAKDTCFSFSYLSSPWNIFNNFLGWERRSCIAAWQRNQSNVMAAIRIVVLLFFSPVLEQCGVLQDQGWLLFSHLKPWFWRRIWWLGTRFRSCNYSVS